MIEIKAPNPFDHVAQKTPSVFLAGSIEQGSAIQWQTKLQEELADIEDLVVLNPRRDEWDSSWEQGIDNPQFNEQVTWEMDAMNAADIIAMYFDEDTKSPITLLELGLHADDQKVIICCPDGFWRRGNVEMVADRYDIPLVNNWDEFVKLLREALALYREV